MVLDLLLRDSVLQQIYMCLQACLGGSGMFPQDGLSPILSCSDMGPDP